GTVVPSHVRVVEVPDVLIQIHPEWRGYSYFVANEDDVVVVDREHRIVATVPVSASGAGLENRGGMAGGRQFNASNVSSDQIRQVQMVLIQQGFLVGEADGVLGSKTRQALITFQQRNGLQATGQIDQQTFASLTSSTTGTQQGNQGSMSTTGQGGAPAP